MPEQKSLTKNAFYSTVKAFMNLAFPLITFPYASRILNPEGIGKINFANSIVAFFVTLALLGTNSYATREAAKIRDDKTALSLFTKEILIINIFSTAFAYISFLFFIFSIQKLSSYLPLLIICSLKIFFIIFGMDWLYSATEEFKYITIRSVVFQIISLVFLFAFVHSEEDLYWYAVFGIFSAVGSNICNFIHARHYVNFFLSGTLQIKKHFKPLLIFFGMAVASNLYTVLDTAMLGFLATDIEIGYYSAANKIVKMIIGILTAISAVLLPRLSYHAEKEQFSAFSSLIEKSIILFWMLSIPMCAGLFLLAKPILLLFSGGNFIEALVPMRIITPVVAIISTTSLLGSPLSALRKEKVSLIAVIIGAVTNFICNVIFIPKFGAKGAAIGTLVAEASVLFFSSLFLFHFIIKKNVLTNTAQIMFATAVMSICVYFLKKIPQNLFLQLGLAFMGGVCSYALLLVLLKNTYFCDTLNKIITMIRSKK